MGYSTSIETLEKMLPYLEPLQKGEPCAWKVPSGQARSFSYKVREALFIASRNETKYPKLAEAKDLFRIREHGETTVIAELREPRSAEQIEVDPAELKVQGQNYEPSKRSGPQTAMSIIEHWSERGDLTKMSFPQANLGQEDLGRLLKWAEAQELVFFVSPEGGITVQPRGLDPKLDEVAFAEEDLETLTPATGG